MTMKNKKAPDGAFFNHIYGVKMTLRQSSSFLSKIR